MDNEFENDNFKKGEYTPVSEQQTPQQPIDDVMRPDNSKHIVVFVVVSVVLLALLLGGAFFIFKGGKSNEPSNEPSTQNIGAYENPMDTQEMLETETISKEEWLVYEGPCFLFKHPTTAQVLSNELGKDADEACNIYVAYKDSTGESLISFVYNNYYDDNQMLTEFRESISQKLTKKYVDGLNIKAYTELIRDINEFYGNPVSPIERMDIGPHEAYAFSVNNRYRDWKSNSKLAETASFVFVKKDTTFWRIKYKTGDGVGKGILSTLEL